MLSGEESVSIVIPNAWHICCSSDQGMQKVADEFRTTFTRDMNGCPAICSTGIGAVLIAVVTDTCHSLPSSSFPLQFAALWHALSLILRRQCTIMAHKTPSSMPSAGMALLSRHQVRPRLDPSAMLDKISIQETGL